MNTITALSLTGIFIAHKFVVDSLLFFLFAFGLSYCVTPSIISLSLKKKMFAIRCERSAHINSIPNLGGISIFISLVSAIAIYNIYIGGDIVNLCLPLMILFFTGLKDDLVDISPYNKLFSQLLASIIVILLFDLTTVEITCFTLNFLNYAASVFMSSVFFTFVINSYNLIDGIDGLAGVVGILLLLPCGLFSVYINDSAIATVCFSTVGALCSFLIFNFSAHRKIFMGDTGSLVIGFLIAFTVIKTINSSQNHFFSDNDVLSQLMPGLLCGLLLYQYCDTVRVIVIRIFFLKKSPFKADKNHLHHKFLSWGLSHFVSTLTISFSTLVLGVLLSVTSFYYQIIYIIPVLLMLVIVFTRIIYQLRLFVHLRILSLFSKDSSEII